MLLILKIAVRNLRRSVRRTLLTMASITFGLAVILWLQATLSGREHQMIDTVTSSHTGHLEIFNPLYPENKLLQQSFPDAPSELAAMLPPGSLFSRRAYFPAIASSGEQSVPLVLLDVTAPDTAPYRHAFVVSRPDQHVAWRGDVVPGDPAALIALLCGAATPMR